MIPTFLPGIIQQVSNAPTQGDSVRALSRTGQLAESIGGVTPETLTRLALSLAAVFGVWLVRRIIVRIVAPGLEDPRTRYQWTKGTTYVAYAVAILLLGQIWLSSIRNLGTFFGLITAGLAIALKDLVASLAGWLFIVVRHPFSVGDRIQIGEHRGDVVDLRLFQFSMLEVGNWVHADQSTGRIIHVPNSQVFTVPVANYTDEFAYVWHELRVMVTFESDWRRAKTILQEVLDHETREVAAQGATALRRGSRKFLISYRTFTPKVYTSVEDSGVLLTLRFLAPVRQRRGLNEQLWEAILEAFETESAIDLAYPTQRLFANPLEGKLDARADWPASGPAAPE